MQCVVDRMLLCRWVQRHRAAKIGVIASELDLHVELDRHARSNRISCTRRADRDESFDVADEPLHGVVLHGGQHALLIRDPGVDAFHSGFETSDCGRESLLGELSGFTEEVKFVGILDGAEIIKECCCVDPGDVRELLRKHHHERRWNCADLRADSSCIRRCLPDGTGDAGCNLRNLVLSGSMKGVIATDYRDSRLTGITRATPEINIVDPERVGEMTLSWGNCDAVITSDNGPIAM